MSDIFKRVAFTKRDANLVNELLNMPLLSTVVNNADNIVRFVELSGDSLQFTTSALPFNGPYFPNLNGPYNLNKKDGGTF